MDDIEDLLFSRFVALIHSWTGISLAKNRKTMLQSRLRSRLRELKVESYAAYLGFLETHTAERQIFIDLVTTNETYFYRTPRVWEYLEKEYVPAWFQRNPRATFHVWSAAASSGAEAYTMGMILQKFKEVHPGFQFQILGTDISTEILKEAETAVYSGRTIETLKTNRLDLFKKYLDPKNDPLFSVASEVRSSVQFRPHNLFESLKKPKFFDLVLIRNVLIYFNADDQERVLAQVAATLKPEAALVIGESESLARLKTIFLYDQPLIYRLKQSGEVAA
jgi:chemotaxis protein methyltransferase CheR